MSKKENVSRTDMISKDINKHDLELHRAESMENHGILIPDHTKANEIEENEKFPGPSGSSFIRMFAEFGHKARTICSEIQYMKVEVIFFVYMFSYVVRSVTASQMLMNKACLVHLGRPEYECNNLTAFKELKISVEKLANNYHLGHTLLHMIPASFIALFIGSWSDKYSRKVPITASIFGICLDGIGATLCAYYMRSRIEYYFIAAFLSGITGGFISIMLVMYSYVSDISTSSNRSLRYALMEMAFGLSIPLGGLAGGFIFKYYGYVPVFLTSTCGHIFGLLWVLFVIDETRGLDNTDSWKIKFRNFWSFESFVSSYRATVKWRPNRGREQIWALIAAMSIGILSLAISSTIGFFYVVHLYDWDNPTYSTITAIFSVITTTVMLIVVPVSKRLKIADTWLGLIGSISLMLKMIGTGLAFRPVIYYLVNLLGLFSSLATLAGRTRLSIVASKEDIGKVFAFLTTAEFILPILATAVVSQVFNATLEFFPGLLYIVMGVMLLIPVVIFIWLARIPVTDYDKMKNSPENHEEMEEKSEKSSTLQEEKNL